MFSWDSRVIFLLECKMGTQQPGMPHSPRDPQDCSIDFDGPRDNPAYASFFIEICNQTATSNCFLTMLKYNIYRIAP